MKIRLEGTGDFGLDGEYELEPQPNMREFTRFRKEAELSPSEMTDIITNGGLEVLPFYIYTALHRAGRGDEAGRVLDMPYDLWGGSKIDQDDGEPDDDEADLPLPIGSGEPETGSGAPSSSGRTSPEPSETLV